MDNKTRAEKIVTKFNGEGACLSNTDETYLQELILSQLDEAQAKVREQEALRTNEAVADAVRGAVDKVLDNPEDEQNYIASQRRTSYLTGFTAAREKAAGIAQNYSGLDRQRQIPSAIAERIRAMEDK